MSLEFNILLRIQFPGKVKDKCTGDFFSLLQVQYKIGNIIGISCNF